MVSAPLSAISKDSKERLRLWIRMLRASRSIEAELRERLRQEFDTTLPRFDVMAALYRAPEGMLMSGLSRFLLVSMLMPFLAYRLRKASQKPPRERPPGAGRPTIED